MDNKVVIIIVPIIRQSLPDGGHHPNHPYPPKLPEMILTPIHDDYLRLSGYYDGFGTGR